MVYISSVTSAFQRYACSGGGSPCLSAFEGKRLWSKAIRTGEAEMCHSLGNIEHHHFKFEGHRRRGDVHVHYLGACALSFGDGVELVEGDVMEIRFEGFGRGLRNAVRVEKSGVGAPILVTPL